MSRSSDDDFVEVEAPGDSALTTSTSAAAATASSGLGSYVVRRATNAAVASAVATAVAYAEPAAISYAFETVGVSTLAKGAWTIAASVVPPVVAAVSTIAPPAMSAVTAVASAASAAPATAVATVVGAKLAYSHVRGEQIEG